MKYKKNDLIKTVIALTLCFTAFLPVFSQEAARPAGPPARPAFRMPSIIVSPELLPDNKVTFRIMAPQATNVAISGEWMPGFGTTESLAKNDTCLWTRQRR